MSIKLTKNEVDNIIFDATREHGESYPFPFDNEQIQVKRSTRLTDGRSVKVNIYNKDLTYFDIRTVPESDARELILASEWDDFRN